MKKVILFLLTIMLLLCAGMALADPEYREVSVLNGSYWGQMEGRYYNGFGVYNNTEANSYSYGEYMQGKYSGICIHIFEAHDEVIHKSGTYLNGKANGIITILCKDGRRYTSRYEAGVRVNGSTTLTTGEYEWVTFTTADNAAYTGEVLTGTQIPHGYGTIAYADGSHYVGMFVNGLRQGDGMFMDANHNAVAGQWRDDLVERADRIVKVQPEQSLDYIMLPATTAEITAPTEGEDDTSLESLVERLARSVYMVKIYDQYGTRIGTGSGFLAYDGKHFVTNHHVIEGAAYIIVVSDDGLKEYTLDTILYASKEEDLAILAFPEDPDATPLPLNADAELKRGQQVIAIGSPRGVKNIISLGNISGFTQTALANSPSVVFTAPISPGSSGGTLFNMNGEVIAVVFAEKTDAQNMNFAIPAAIVQKLVDPKNLAMQSLVEYNELGRIYPRISGFAMEAVDGTITFSWQHLEGAVQYMLLSNTPERPDELQQITAFRSSEGASAFNYTFTGCKAHPEFLYTYYLIAIDAEDCIISKMEVTTSVDFLSIE